MILDALPQWRTYSAIVPRLSTAFEFLNKITVNTPVTRHEIDGENIYAFVQKYVTKPSSEGQFESHRKYIDIQYVHIGSERILWAPLVTLAKVAMPYDDSGDAALYDLTPRPSSFQLAPGQFAIFFPEDAHVPGCDWDGAVEVLKVVVKVRI